MNAKWHRRVVLTGILGLTTTVVVAWAVAAAGVSQASWRWREEGYSASGVRWTMFRAQGLAGGIVGFDCWTAHDPRSGQDVIAEFLERPVFDDIPAWARWRAPMRKAKREFGASVHPMMGWSFHGSGWPFVGLYRTTFIHDWDEPPVDRGGLWWRLPVSGYVVLPYLPFWPGLVGNMALYGGAWWLLLYGRSALRRRRRRNRGLCIKCGYELLGEYEKGCPECGLGRGSAIGEGA